MLKLISKKKIISLISILIILFSLTVNISAYNNNYYIGHYNVDIEVREDNSYYVEETIDAYFDSGANKHGIIRYIPLKNDIYREDGSTGKTSAKISDIKVEGADYEVDKSSREVSIKIGSAYEVVEGKKTYKISYVYSLGRDILSDKDEFYFNIIGTEWDTDINEVEFTIKFPKEFDYSKLGFTKGISQSVDSEDIFWRVENNIVYGYYHNVLPPYNALTMRLELPEGYFVYVPSFLEKFGSYIMMLPMLLVTLVTYIYNKFGKNDEIVETIEFYPPDNLNPLDIGYLYDGSIDRKDVSSLLIYLANQGYIEIEEVWEDRFIIRILKEYLGNNPDEEAFFRGLKNRMNDNGEIEVKTLNNKFYKVVDSIIKNYKKRNKLSEIIVPTWAYKTLGIIFALISIFIAMFFMSYYSSFDIGRSTLIAFVVPAVLLFYVPFFIALFNTKGLFGKIVVGAILFIHLGVLLFMFSVYIRNTMSNLINNPFLLGLGVLGIVLGIIMIVLSFKMYKRTAYGNEMLGKIRGFKTFLEEAEKDKLEELVEEDPSYFYNILPYSHVLGVSSKWIKKFDDIAMPPPEWYVGDSYSHHDIHHHLDDSFNSIGDNMISSPVEYSSSGSSGGFSSGGSGGGSSGGGSGGGGGSSW